MESKNGISGTGQKAPNGTPVSTPPDPARRPRTGAGGGSARALGGFSQGFDFIVLDTPDQVEWFNKVTTHPQFPDEALSGDQIAPCLVLAIANKPAYLERYSRPDKERYGLQKAAAWPVPYWDVDTGMAVMLILLAALEQGLGALFFGLFWGEDVLLRELDVPDGCRPIGVIALGYPLDAEKFDAARFAARRRALESMVHFGRW
ncbi:MAG TPA: nitroreductase family protein [Candidatus Dormibacteraeota bacterium]|nr:nitroreductase family protein [Candidatus Dormibacteraeota bacterium]